MAFKNLMEDIVKNVVEEILKNEKNLLPEDVKNEDILAYVLNRIPPKYVTSERGILHGKLFTKFSTQQKSDILFYVYEAINVIKERRESSVNYEEMAKIDEDYQFPHIVGEVLEESTFSMIPDMEVKMSFDGQIVKMLDSGWKNPYKTNKATMGYFHFWPAFDKDLMGVNDIYSFVLEFSHPNFVAKKIELQLKLIDNSFLGKSHVIPLVLVPLKQGIDVDVLYK